MTTQSITSGQEKQLIRFGSDAIEGVLKEVGLDKEAAQRVIARGGEFQERIAVTVREVFCDFIDDESTIYPVTVDYRKTVDEMIVEGRHNTRGNDITQYNVTLHGAGQVEVELHLVHLNRGASTDTVLAELDRRGFRPAKIEELLAFGIKHPNLQKYFEIVALGSVVEDWEGCQIVVGLGYWGDELGLGLWEIVGGWDGHCRFLAASK